MKYHSDLYADVPLPERFACLKTTKSKGDLPCKVMKSKN